MYQSQFRSMTCGLNENMHSDAPPDAEIHCT